VEVTIKLDNGEYRAIVQQDEGENFQPGERVRLVKGSSATRVAR
jgi:outer membrane lipoprotein SlyB